MTTVQISGAQSYAYTDAEQSAIRDLTDVNLTGIQDGDVLIYRRVNDEWVVGHSSIGGIPVDLTGILDNNILRYDESLGKFVPSTDVSVPVIMSETPPTRVASGDLWCDTDNMHLFVYYTDNDSSQWVNISGGGSGAGVYISEDPPPSAHNSSLWWDCGTGNLFIKYSNQWININNTNGGDGRTIVSDTRPSDPYDGMSWYYPARNALMLYQSNIWFQVN